MYPVWHVQIISNRAGFLGQSNSREIMNRVYLPGLLPKTVGKLTQANIFASATGLYAAARLALEGIYQSRGFKTDEDFENSSLASEKVARDVENKGRWDKDSSSFFDFIMTTTVHLAKPPKLILSGKAKRQRHAEAQRKYRERNLEAMHAKAQERMQRLRAKICTPEQIQDAADKRREADTDCAELLPHLARKFVAKFGHKAFMEFYYPQYELCGNYGDDKEHDRNPRKFWFLLLEIGLFTKKTDADPLCQPEQILIFFTKKLALAQWATHCHKRHAHDGDDIVPKSDPGSESSTEEDSSTSPSRSSHSSPVPLMHPAASHGANTRKTTPVSLKCEGSAVKPPVSARCGTSLPRKPLPQYLDDDGDDIPVCPLASIKREGVPVKRKVILLLLYRDDSPPTSAERESCKRSARAVTPTPTAGLKHARGRPSPALAPWPPRSPPTSPNLSLLSLSLIAPTTVVPSDQSALQKAPGHPFCSLAASVSSSGTSLSHATASPSAQLLYNNTTHKIYKDAEKAVREMATTETVQVVECKDVVGYCAGQGRKMAG
ncbi:hypothetical protein C8R44DRAFT_734988 [Mycena epipterygia]|nr:hypothetical protein C8R44DRAFT_734988 [Mycena epipterygia]